MIQAQKLLEEKKYDELRVLLEKALPRTQTDIQLFHVYISFLEQTGKTSDLEKAFEYCWPKVQHHFDVYPFLQRYTKFLIENSSNLAIEQDFIGKARIIYQISLRNPSRDFIKIWKDYEMFETIHNRANARKTLSLQLPIYQKTFRLFSLYKSLLEYSGEFTQPIEFSHFFEILDFEVRNVAFLEDKLLHDRIMFIFNYFAENFKREEVFFTKSEYLRNSSVESSLNTVRDGIMAVKDKFFLYCYYATLGPNEIFDEAFDWYDSLSPVSKNPDMRDSIVVNHLSHVLKHKGIEAFRDGFISALKTDIGPQVFIFVGKAEFYAFNEHAIAIKILIRGHEQFPDYLPLQETLLQILLINGDLSKARSYFEKFIKTPRISQMMANHEFLYGSYDKFRDLTSTLEAQDPPPKSSDFHKITNRYERTYNLFKKHINVFEHQDKELTQKMEILKPFMTLRLPLINIKAFVEFLGSNDFS